MTALPELPHPPMSLTDELAELLGPVRAALADAAPAPARVPALVRATARVRGAATAAGSVGVLASAGLHVLPVPFPLVAAQLATVAGALGLALVGLGVLLSLAGPSGRRLPAQALSAPLPGRWAPVDAGRSTGPGACGRAHGVSLVLDAPGTALPVAGRRDAAARALGRRPAEESATFGRPVLAVADATVVRVVDGVRDHRSRAGVLARVGGALGDAARELAGPRAVLGNHVVLDCGQGRYAVLAHLQRRSARVAVGDRVLPGDVIASAGCSGAAEEPQVELLLLDSPHPLRAAGLPVRLEARGRR